MPEPEGTPLPLNYSRRGLNSGAAGADDSEAAQAFLDQAYEDLCMACRAGDLDTVDTLLSTPNLNINFVDEWDYSPLILASLCGHERVVQLLLERGALCDRDTFEGARCIYGALNDGIRDLLISFDVSKKVDISQPFASHISSLLNPQAKIQTRDVVFTFPHIHGTLTRDYQRFELNKFLLVARSPFFREKFAWTSRPDEETGIVESSAAAGAGATAVVHSKAGSWFQVSEFKMGAGVDPAYFKMIVDYVYLRTDNLPVGDADKATQLAQMAASFQLDDLVSVVNSVSSETSQAEKSKLKNESSVKLMDNARENMRDFLQSEIIANRVSIPIEEEEAASGASESGSESGSDNDSEEDFAVDFEDVDVEKYVTDKHLQQLLQGRAVPDVVVAVIDIGTESVVYYPVHRSILARSPYFETMFSSDIFKTQESDKLPVIRLSASTSSTSVAEMVLSFLYHDDVAHIPLLQTIDLLFAADELFLDRLKTMAAVKITSEFKDLAKSSVVDRFKKEVGYTPYELIRISWQTHSDRLEQHITKVLAYHLRYIYDNIEHRGWLKEIIRESAARILDREDTDTIELIDDIRYYLLKKYGINEFEDFEPTSNLLSEEYIEIEDIRVYKKALSEYERDKELVDSLLEELDLEA